MSKIATILVLMLALAGSAHAQQLNPGGFGGVGTSAVFPPGPVSITGNSANGTDQISKVNINGVINPMTYGAKCDGVTNDAPAFQAALNTLGTSTTANALYIPPTPKGCVIGNVLTYSTYTQMGAAVNGPLKIFGDGPSSTLIITNTTGGIDIEGSCAAIGTIETVNLSEFQLKANAGATIGFGIKVFGTAQSNITRVVAQGYGAPNQFAKGFWVLGMQQSTMLGLVSGANIKGIVMDECHNTAQNWYAGSNATSIIDFGSLSDQGTGSVGIEVDGGTGDNAFIGNHIAGPQTGIAFHMNGTNTNGAGNIGVYNLHTEYDNVGIDVATTNAGAIDTYNWNDYNGGKTSMHVEAGSQSVSIHGGLLNGALQFDAGIVGLIKVLDNVCLEVSPINNAGIGKVISYGINTNCNIAQMPGGVAQFETPIIGTFAVDKTAPIRGWTTGKAGVAITSGGTVAMGPTGNNQILDLIPGSSPVHCRFFLAQTGVPMKENDSGGTNPVCGVAANAATCGTTGTAACTWNVYNNAGTWTVQNLTGANDNVSYKAFAY